MRFREVVGESSWGWLGSCKPIVVPGFNGDV